jgi:hypothetical protein
MDTQTATPQYDVTEGAIILRSIMDAFGTLAEKDRVNQLVREKPKKKKLKNN